MARLKEDCRPLARLWCFTLRRNPLEDFDSGVMWSGLHSEMFTLADVFRMDCGELGAGMGEHGEEATAVLQDKFLMSLNQRSSSGSSKKSSGFKKKKKKPRTFNFEEFQT